MRSPYQVLIFPFRKNKDKQIEYAIFKRSDMKIWQGISGGGEDGEKPIESAEREVFEETGSEHTKLISLSSVSSIPVEALRGFVWGKDVLVVPEYTFGFESVDNDIELSSEHIDFEWLPYEKAYTKLKWDSNKNALWELNYRLTHT